MYDNNISIHRPCCRPGIGPDRSGLRGAFLHRVARPVLKRGTPGYATSAQTPPPPDTAARAPTGPPPGDPRAAATDSPSRSAAMVGREPGDVCQAPVHRPSPGRAPRAQGPHRRHSAARLACRPGTRPGAWGGVKEGPPRRAEAHLRSQGWTTGSVANTDWRVRRGRASTLYAANPNSWLITRFWARTSLLTIPSIWPLWSLCMASSP
jgi:hypothetical protein